MPRFISPRSFFSSDPRALLAADPPPVVDVEGQPLAANAERLVKALDFLARFAGRHQHGTGEGRRGQGCEEGAGDARQARALSRDQSRVAREGGSRTRPRRGCSRRVGRRCSSRWSTRAR